MNLKITALSVLFLLLAQVAYCNEAATAEDPASAETTDPAGETPKPDGEAGSGEGADGKPKVKKGCETPKCQLPLMKVYGLEGVESSIRGKLDLCPIGDYSCCSIKDQLTIVDRWVTNKGEENMKAKLVKHEEVKIHYTIK